MTATISTSFSELSLNELTEVSGGVQWCDLGVAVLGFGGMIVGGPVGIGIGLFCTGYAITRAFGS